MLGGSPGGGAMGPIMGGGGMPGPGIIMPGGPPGNPPPPPKRPRPRPWKPPGRRSRCCCGGCGPPPMPLHQAGTRATSRSGKLASAGEWNPHFSVLSRLAARPAASSAHQALSSGGPSPAKKQRGGGCRMVSSTDGARTHAQAAQTTRRPPSTRLPHYWQQCGCPALTVLAVLPVPFLLSPLL